MRYFAIIILLTLVSCNTERKAAKKSDKHFFKAVAWDKANVHGRCSDIAPPIVMTKDSFIYKPGKVIYKQGEPVYVEVDCDSVIKAAKSLHDDGIGKKSLQVKIPCPPCDSVRVDTAYISVRNTEVDRNKEIALTEQLRLSEEGYTATKTLMKIWRVIAIALALLILVPWVIKRFVK